jgi:hypothetical protein
MHEMQKLNDELICGFYAAYLLSSRGWKNELQLTMFELW